MARRHRYQKSSNGAPFNAQNASKKKKSYPPRNQAASFNAQRDMGSFDGRADWRFESGPPPFWGWQHRPGRWFSYYDGPSQRPFKSAPPPLPHEPAGPESFYPLPFLMDRALGSQFRHGYPDYDNRLFLDEYRFPGPHQIYQPPHLEGENLVPSENVCESEDKPEAQSKKLRGEAPEFVPRSKFAAEEEPKAKVKEPCWLVVSSQ